MTTFLDGPAKGQTLMLRRCPVFLRVVESGGKWDALDQPSDTPRSGETLYAYSLVGRPGVCYHINCGRKGGGGTYPISEYRLVENQPATAEMASTEDWRAWCAGQPAPKWFQEKEAA